MTHPEILQLLAERLGASATVKNVFGEPIAAGGKTIVPVAAVAYGFGGGGGAREEKEHGGGGGGGVRATAVGVVEITEESTRFIPADANRKLALAALAGFALGIVFGRFVSGGGE